MEPALRNNLQWPRLHGDLQLSSIPNKSCVIFSDGATDSELNGGGGHIIFNKINFEWIQQSSAKVLIGAPCTPYNAETISATRGLQDAKRNNAYGMKSIWLASDCQSVDIAARDTAMHPSMPSSILDLKQTISEIRKDTVFDTAWTPGHCGIEFNVAADLLAKQALPD